jgi:hypothetical protein
MRHLELNASPSTGAVTAAASVTNGTFQNDHAVAATLAPVEGAASVTIGEAHRYWRLWFTGDNGDPNNIILLRYVGMSVDGNTAEVLDDSMTASASSSFFGAPGDEITYNPQNVLPPTNIEGWATASGSSWPQWWKVDVGVGNELFPTSVWITPQTVARSPSGFILQWSDDNSSWTDVETFTSTTGWSAENIRQFVLS